MNDARLVARLVEQNRPFARWCVRGMLAGRRDAEDVVAYAELGLVEAARRWNPERGLRFSTFAVHWCTKYARRYVASRSAVVNTSQYGRVRMGHVQAPVFSLDFRSDATGETWGEQLIDPAPSALDRMLAAEAAGGVRARVARLPLRERRVIEFRFGLNGAGGHRQTFVEIGRRLGLSRERVRQIEAEALARLRRAFDGRGGAR